MTPVPHVARLHAVAAWDVAVARRAVSVLAGTSERLVAWRTRLDGIGRALESGDCWSGPAARSAVAALAEMSAVGSAVGSALGASLAVYDRLVAEAARAQELAERSVVAVPPVPGAAEAALGQAARVAAAAEEVGDPLAGLGVRDAFAPVDFQDLLVHVPVMGPIRAPGAPSGRPPAEVARWWAALSAAQQRAVISLSPAVVGALDGVPAWARDRANRRLLDGALRDPRTPDAASRTAGMVAARIAAEEAAGQRVQLQLLVLADDRVVLSLGDLDTADTVVLLVPGVGNSPHDLGALVGQATHLGAAAEAASAGTTVASVVWLGYRPPGTVVSGSTRLAAWRGGPALADSLAGLAAARTATGTGPPRTTVVAHSYGTVVVDEAADSPGRLAADAVVLLGSPGMEDDAASLEAPAVFDAASWNDPVATLGWFGDHRTGADAYGSTGLPVAPGAGHSDYLDPGFPTLTAVGQVVAGRRAPE